MLKFITEGINKLYYRYVVKLLDYICVKPASPTVDLSIVLCVVGIFFVLPCIESYTKVDLRTVSFDVPPQEVISSHLRIIIIIIIIIIALSVV